MIFNLVEFLQRRSLKGVVEMNDLIMTHQCEMYACRKSLDERVQIELGRTIGVLSILCLTLAQLLYVCQIPVSTGKELLGGNIITVEFEPVIGESSDTEAVSDF